MPSASPGLFLIFQCPHPPANRSRGPRSRTADHWSIDSNGIRKRLARGRRFDRTVPRKTPIHGPRRLAMREFTTSGSGRARWGQRSRLHEQRAYSPCQMPSEWARLKPMWLARSQSACPSRSKRALLAALTRFNTGLSGIRSRRERGQNYRPTARLIATRGPPRRETRAPTSFRSGLVEVDPTRRTTGGNRQTSSRLRTVRPKWRVSQPRPPFLREPVHLLPGKPLQRAAPALWNIASSGPSG